MPMVFTTHDAFHLIMGSATAVSYVWMAILGFRIGRKASLARQTFAISIGLFAYSLMMATLAASPIARAYPAVIVGSPLISGYIAATFLIYTSSVVNPQNPCSLRWLVLGIPGTAFSLTALSIDGGLDYLTQYIHHGLRTPHPMLTPMFSIHTAALFVGIAGTFVLVIRGIRQNRNIAHRRALVWMSYGLASTVGLLLITNLLPLLGFPSFTSFAGPMTIPITVLCFKALQSHTDALDKKHQREQEKLVGALETLGHLARGVGHDMNNLLTGVTGSAELIRLKSGCDPALTPHINQIVTTAMRAGQLMNSMQSLSGEEPKPQPIRPEALVLEAVHTAEAQMPPGVRLEANTLTDLPWVAVHPQALVGAVLNLILNASEAIGSKQGIVKIKIEYVAQAIIPPDAMGEAIDGQPALLISVKDDGCGMAPSTLKQAFEPFFSTKGSGRGLGLMTVFSVVQNTGGAIAVSSTPGKGTRFDLWLPACPPTGAPHAIQNEESTVLLVEDDETVRPVIAEILRTFGFTVTAKDCAESGFSWIRTQSTPPSLSILDIRLPGESGIRLAHKLLAQDSDRRIVLMSGDEPLSSLTVFDGHTNVRFLRKPVTMSRLRAELVDLGFDLAQPKNS